MLVDSWSMMAAWWFIGHDGWWFRIISIEPLEGISIDGFSYTIQDFLWIRDTRHAWLCPRMNPRNHFPQEIKLIKPWTYLLQLFIKLMKPFTYLSTWSSFSMKMTLHVIIWSAIESMFKLREWISWTHTRCLCLWCCFGYYLLPPSSLFVASAI